MEALKEEAERLDSEIKAAIDDLLREVSKYGHLASASEMIGLSDTDIWSYKHVLGATPKLEGIEKLGSKMTEAKSGLGIFQISKEKELGNLISELNSLHAQVEEQRDFISEKQQELKTLIKDRETEINRMLAERKSLDD